MENNTVTVQTTVQAPIEKVWDCWSNPQHITGWAFASDDWEAPSAENDLRTGGTFMTRMQAKGAPAGSAQETDGFDFNGVYTNVVDHKVIEYDMGKGPGDEKARHVKITFTETPDGVQVIETFDPENENTLELQHSGWQAILDNFKKYTESH